jgi:hypothetical protein
MLGPYEVVAKPARFFASQNDDPSRPLGEPFKHWTPLPGSAPEGAVSPAKTPSYRMRNQYIPRFPPPLDFFFTSNDPAETTN